MEQRKLIKLGNSSFAIALPKDWVEKSGLKKGDNIFLERNGNGEVIVSPEFKKSVNEKKVVIEFDGKNEKDIKREFTSDYIRGGSAFYFRGRVNHELKKAIKNMVNEYVSCEVTEENSDEIVVKDLFNIEEMNMANFIKRIDNNIKEILYFILENINKNKFTKKEMDEIEKVDSDINKFYFLNSRIMIMGLNNPSVINKLKIGPLEFFNNWWLTFHLEQIGDNLKYVIKKIGHEKLNENDRRNIFNILTKINDKYIQSLEVFYGKDKKKAYKLMNDLRVAVLCESLIKNPKSFLSLLGERLRQIDKATYQIVKMVSYLKE